MRRASFGPATAPLLDRSRARRWSVAALTGVLCAVTGLGQVVAAPTPGAAEYAVHPDLVEAQTEYARARGGDAYVALDRIWDTWERANPLHVEEALIWASESKAHPAPVRAHASVLRAFARVRRGDLAAARSLVRDLGFVDRWLLVGPFDNEGKAGFEAEFGPEAEPAAPIVPGRAYSGKERPVRWRVVPDNFPFGWVDTSSLLRPESHVCAVATTFVSGGADQKRERNITAWVGTAGAFKMTFNGQPVLADEAYRGFDVGRMGVTLRLRPGVNRLALKVCGDETAPIFSVRLGDAQGRPDKSLTVSNDIRLSEEAAANVQAARDDKRPLPAHPRELFGPLQDFALRTGVGSTGLDGSGPPKAPPRVAARDLESYATYLVETGGDDPAKHQARDLARRAAEQEPTVERLLLAARLSEDRNQAARWIEQAAKMAREPRTDVLLAQAWHHATGPNPRQAFPLYDRVLELDPDNVQALRGRVELYNAAGLRRSALGALERALERNPHSVLLLNMVSSQLAALGRTTEAAELEERYFARRFDDSTYLTQQLELAVNRRSAAASNHWFERMFGTDPQSLWVHQLGARVYRNFGEPERALTSLERARELAPEDVGVLRALADLQGELGRRDEQLRLMQEILRLKPQDRDTREYVEHIEPPEAKPDEIYASAPEEFLKLRHAPAAGHNRRTLRDLTVSTVYPNGLSSRFRQVVFQPLTDSAAALSRQYAFHYQADSQVVQLKGARVYRGDGRIDEAIESGEGAADDPSIAMYTSARTYYVQFPRLEPGDVVELRYRVDDVTPRNEFADYFGEVVYLQNDEPTQNAEYVLITPKSRKLYIDEKLPGLKRTVTEKGDQRIYRFVADKVAPITPEPAMPPWPEVLGFVHVSTYASWKDLGRWYWGLVHEQFDLDEETRKLAREITKNAKTDLEKVQAVYGWVVKNTRYVALEFGIHGYKPRRCVQTVARGWGDCKDKATVIVTLLKELGIDARLVILRTQLRGDFASELPSLAPFDHAIAYVPSLDLYLDGTAEHTGSTELPVMDQSAIGLHIFPGDAKLVRLPPPDPEKNVITRRLEAQLGRDGAAKVKMAFEVRGQSAPSWRRRYEAQATLKQRLSHDLGRDYPGFELAEDSVRTGDMSQLEVPVTLELTGRAPTFGRKQNNQLTIPLTGGSRLTQDYASLTKRTQDVRIQGFSTRDDTFQLELPPGARILSLPPSVHVDTRFGTARVDIEQQGNKVLVKSRLLLKVNRVKPSEYGEWKQFCTAADQAMGHKLVIGL